MKYFYSAKSYEGEVKTGEMIARDERSVAQQLKSDGFLVTSITALGDTKSNKIKVNILDQLKTVSLKEKMMFARNLSVMLSSGLPISKSIKNLADQTKNKTFTDILKKINEDLRTGKSLSDSIAQYPRVFSELFINMVKVGEIGGNLEETLKIIATQLEKEHSLKSKIRGAMMYPAVILVAMLGVGILMLTYILPKITGVFADMDVVLPASTQFIVMLSDFLMQHSVLVTITFFGGLVGFKIFLSTKIGKITLGFVLLKLPVIKNIVIKINCARFSRIYSSLLKSGVSSTTALKIVANTLSNHYYKKAIRDSVKQIQKGIELSVIIKKNEKIFPVLVYQMVEVGEQTGETEKVLLKMAVFYEEEIDQITKNLSAIIEPILMVVIGVGVGFFAVSMLQPMYSLMENIN